jgi:hypothetical protein
MTTRIQNRRASTPAYYLARPASLWLAALAPRPANRTSPCPSGAERPGAGVSDTERQADAKE